MDFMHGLAIVLIMFEGIIIQCKGTFEDLDSIDWIQDAPIIDITGNQQLWPDELIELVVSKTDFETVKTTVRSRIVNASNDMLTEILRDRIIVIFPHDFWGNTDAYYDRGELFLRFGSYEGLVCFFKQFGTQLKRIEINYSTARNYDHRIEINQNIIKRFAKYFEELQVRIRCRNQGLWDWFSNGDNDIIFPNVKKFQFHGEIGRNEFKLKSIFPRLESFKFVGDVNDVNFLAGITTLKELNLHTNSIGEHQLDHIFANNRNITKLTLFNPSRLETIQAIATYLTKLESLEVKDPEGNFWFQFNGMGKYELSSLNHLDISFGATNEIIGDLSFYTPHLKKLSLSGSSVDDQIIPFIYNFKEELETVELLSFDHYYNPVECIVTLKNVKEFTTKSFEDSKLKSLQKMFKNFDTKSKLQTLKLLDFHNLYQSFEYTMKKLNYQLKKSRNPTWKLSLGEQERTGQKCLIFERDL